jgi:hypothetical protein
MDQQQFSGSIHCPICGYDRFDIGQMDWLSPDSSADAETRFAMLGCRRCGHVSFFESATKPVVLKADEKTGTVSWERADSLEPP